MEEKLAPRLEDYLETIYLLEKRNRVARVKEIAKERNVRMPTVTEVLKKLAGKGFIEYEPYGYVRTTKKGREYAKTVYRKHRILKEFLKDILGLSPEEAEEEGCLIEHFLPCETVRRFEELTRILKKKGIKIEGNSKC